MLWLIGSLLACDVGAPAPLDAPRPHLVAPAPPAPPAAPEPRLDASDLPAPDEVRYAASHVLVGFAGSRSASDRPRDEALALALDLRRRALEGEPFAELARRWSDDPSAPRGGRLGVYLTGTYDAAFERAVASVASGAVGPVVETPWGFHVVRREPVD